MIEPGALGAAEFCKYHALGNDYLVIDGTHFGGAISGRAMAALCHRHTGVGSDGVLVLGPGDETSDASLRIFNPDGSEAEKSGNGLRIAGRALYDLGYVHKEELQLRLDNALVAMKLILHAPTGGRGRPAVRLIEVAMGVPRLDSVSMAMSGPARSTLHEPLQVLGHTLTVTAVSMGNPHCVVFHPGADVALLRHLGPAIEHHERFTRRTNVQFAKVIDRGRVELLIWERGAGETSASGSSSCAAVAAAQARGLCDDDVQVVSPGGTLQVSRARDGCLMLTGPAEPVCRGIWLPEGSP